MSTSVLPSHHMIERLIARVLWDDASTPVPLLWLTAQEPWWCWDGTAQGRLLLSAVRLQDRMAPGGRRRRGEPAKGVMRRATVPLFLDSGAFSWLTKHRSWADWPARDFAAFISHACEVLGSVEHAGIQDWMCEPHMLARTGLTVEEHQRRTVASFLELRKLAPAVPWVPTLQGYTLADYLRCAQMYEDAGVRLRDQPLVGLGSVCRRSGSLELVELIARLAAALPGVRFHGFGVKDEGVLASLLLLASIDSEAWSSRGRGLEKNIRLGLGLPIDAPWSAVIAADDQALDLDLVGLIAWRSEHATGGLMNSQAFAERWRLRQLAKMCARLVEQTTGRVDINTEPQMDLFT
jgi:hypothetical protein